MIGSVLLAAGGLLAGGAVPKANPFDGEFVNAAHEPCAHITLAPNGSDRGFMLRVCGSGQPEEMVTVGDWWKGAYAPRGAKPPYATNSVINITSRLNGKGATPGIAVHLLPWYGMDGIYNPDETAKNWAAWTADFVPYAERTFIIDIETDPETGRNFYSFMGHPAGSFATTGLLEKVTYHLHETNMTVRASFGPRPARDPQSHALASVAKRTSPVLPADAAISLKPGAQRSPCILSATTSTRDRSFTSSMTSPSTAADSA